MKKTLIAIAFLATSAAGAFAQSEVVYVNGPQGNQSYVVQHNGNMTSVYGGVGTNGGVTHVTTFGSPSTGTSTFVNSFGGSTGATTQPRRNWSGW
jgi:hypothetical protein